MPKAKAAPVQVRSLTPLPSDDPGSGLYQPVPQIEGKPEMRVSWPLVNPEQARQWVLASDEHFEEFRQRSVHPRDVQRWLLLMESDRFVDYFPGGPLCFDPEGLLLNGKHRLTALTRQSKSRGFMVIRNVPRWMYSFFDTGRPRTINDVFHIAGRVTNAQLGSTTRLAMRYEEFLRGGRAATNWKEWGKHRDEHSDVDAFLAPREEISDLYQVCDQTYRGSRLIIASLMVFRFYQSMAWPEGAQKLTEFFDGLRQGAMLPIGSPALVLREWSKDLYDTRERVHGKRELHLLLLNRMFALFSQGDRIPKLTWAHGFPMSLPYHPDGSEMALKNVIAKIDTLLKP